VCICQGLTSRFTFNPGCWALDVALWDALDQRPEMPTLPRNCWRRIVTVARFCFSIATVAVLAMAARRSSTVGAGARGLVAWPANCPVAFTCSAVLRCWQLMADGSAGGARSGKMAADSGEVRPVNPWRWSADAEGHRLHTTSRQVVLYEGSRPVVW